MATQNWIPLFEYSSKYNVSLSTLRRRIKNHSILFKLDGGKYYILDDEQRGVEKSPVSNQPSAHFEPVVTVPPAPLTTASYVEASVLTSAHRLVEELKAAYAKILQEKEEQIGLLKEQILDLNMLVSLLEKQNDQKTHQQMSAQSLRSKNENPAPERSSAGSELNIESFYFPEIES